MDKIVELFKETVNISDLISALTVTWQGMAAIFIVMAVIAVIVFGAAQFSGKKK